jgi:predicted RNase H-like HicB family nuclease
MSAQQSTKIAGYRLPIVVEQVNGCYQATSPALDGLLVLADTIDEVLALVPGVARALLEAMKEKGVTPPIPIEEVLLPAHTEVLIPA